MNQELNNLDALSQSFINGPNFRPYISSLVLSNYKNISRQEELRFDFPLTFLIGKNGTNKSSLLHALFGCPKGKSTSSYWFSTHLDPIANDEENRPVYFYRYIIPETGDEAEVIKLRIQKYVAGKLNPEYWEPSRPVKKYGMKSYTYEGRPSQSQTRWDPIEKKVVYLDFRGELSAFDKAFFREPKGDTPLEHNNMLRRNSKALKEVIEKNLATKKRYRKERVRKNYIFSKSEREIVNNILDADYKKIVYIEHDFYNSNSFSVYLKKDDHNGNYSEAFAGSGETSIVRLIYEIERAPAKSLILLDEPETSLHVSAQKKLRNFILQKIKTKYLQVVISTHSPHFTEGLPDSAIKALYIDENSRKVRIINATPANESSFHLGQKRIEDNKVHIYTEDKLAKAILENIIRKKLNNNIKDKISIRSYAGGASNLLQLAATEMRLGRKSCFLFDGDQKLTESIPQSSDILDKDLKDTFIKTFGYIPSSLKPDAHREEELLKIS